MKALILCLVLVAIWGLILGLTIRRRVKKGEVLVRNNNQDPFPIPDLKKFHPKTMGPHELPRFLQAAQREADRLGMPLDKFLERDLEKALASTYPSDNCITDFEEVCRQVRSGMLSPNFEKHLDECGACRGLVKQAKQLGQK